MERLTTLVVDVDASFGDLLDHPGHGRGAPIRGHRRRPDRSIGVSRSPAISGTREWDVAALHEPYGDGTYHGRLLKRVQKHSARWGQGRRDPAVPVPPRVVDGDPVAAEPRASLPAAAQADEPDRTRS